MVLSSLYFHCKYQVIDKDYLTAETLFLVKKSFKTMSSMETSLHGGSIRLHPTLVLFLVQFFLYYSSYFPSSRRCYTIWYNQLYESSFFKFGTEYRNKNSAGGPKVTLFAIHPTHLPYDHHDGILYNSGQYGCVNSFGNCYISWKVFIKISFTRLFRSADIS